MVISELLHDDCADLANHASGDASAFARLYDRHAPVVLALCRREGAVVSDAEDACQETFIRAHTRLGNVTDCRGFRSWLYAIARLVCKEHRRAAGRRSRKEEQAMIQVAQERGGAGSAVIARIEHTEASEALTVAIDSLPDDERLAIHIYYLEHDPVSTAAATLKLSRSGFYKLVNRARAHIAQSMGVAS
ncbi:MAG: RNA polymerase sigma factor [Planctomycetota bacterium]|nr:RNA polymerase sigma factor [Planctomycetota bacterium]MDA1105383.1 RNA polymerase sigma factor [Planctomycetota bacterium]